MNKVYCKGCHIELSKGVSHSCIKSKKFCLKPYLTPFYFRDKKGKFTNAR